MSIRPLSKVAVDKIKSSSAVTSLNEVVCGLLRNSLDARSSKVNIHLDFALGNCVVEDDGLGVDPSEFGPDGGLGKLHHTSKIPPNPKLHGSHGNFLASVANLSLLAITSQHHRHETQAFLSVHNGQVLARHVPAPPDQRFDFFSHGTRVSIRNLFGSMPVRVKQRGLLFSDRTRTDKEWETLIRDMAALLVAWPSEVSLLLREAKTQRETRLRSGNTDLVCRTSRLFTQAGLAESEDAGSWVPVSASSRRVRIKGAISKVPVATRRSQIMCLGIRPVPNSFGTNVLYEEANKIFTLSSFGLVEGDERDKVQGKPKKGVERWPMFYLEIHLLGAGEGIPVDDVLGDSQHCLQAIIDLLKVVCYGFLKKYCLRPNRIVRSDPKPTNAHVLRSSQRRTGQATMRHMSQAGTRPPSASGDYEFDQPYSPFDTWNRIKVGKAISTKSTAGCGAEPPDAPNVKPATETPHRLMGDNGELLRTPFGDVDEIRAVNVTQPQSRDMHGTGDEVSGEVDNSANETTESTGDVHSNSVPARKQVLPVHRSLESRPKSQPEEWLQGVLRSWKNPIFETTEPRIPTVHQDLAGTERAVEVRRDGQWSKFFPHANDVQFEAIAMSLSGRVSRSALASAEVIGQVDRKFILLQLPLHTAEGSPSSDPSSALIMIDQHAADERYRLEELMSLYFEPSGDRLDAVTQSLERPVLFEVSARECELLQRHHTHFQMWGVIYNIERVKDAIGYKIKVSGLPPSILERCRSEPKLIIDLMRREIWQYEDGSLPPRPSHEPGRSWVSCFHSCPRGILELLHSRSCRSAIMFNDELSMEECIQLVRQLARCAFPFQCAHGRPSMVPVVDVGLGSGRLGYWKESNLSLGIDRWAGWLADRG
ncbi:DNA mismatch repair protein [Conoideocrella luteorostrata]|uniref:DNA mismatch repair protein n=1 Tax=Conoideocrella luteorostrata TaxID=1105319 RepID=A0AAJ0FVB0_9HYPO|nr:DNA mismatch repair protein [Conoideocrella luteorostrata]